MRDDPVSQVLGCRWINSPPGEKGSTNGAVITVRVIPGFPRALEGDSLSNRLGSNFVCGIASKNEKEFRREWS